MRISGRMLAEVLQHLKKEIKVGMSTKDLSDMAADYLKELGGKPAFLGYYGFPDVLCVSVNDEVVHGIPNKNKFIQNGDKVSMDFGVVIEGMVTDGAISVVVGTTKNKKLEHLLLTTEDSLIAGIETLKDGIHVGDISAAVEAVLKQHHYGIVRDLVGHGVGHFLHEEPNIPNYVTNDMGMELVEGMTIAIEPMATLGGHAVFTDKDGWTIRTRDGSMAAHFEHTILITKNGYEILTKI